MEKVISKDALTAKEALSLLLSHVERGKKRVHSFMSSGFGLFGCDIDLMDVKKYFKTATIVLAGPNMRGMGHGVAYRAKEGDSWCFLETDETKLNAILHERGE